MTHTMQIRRQQKLPVREKRDVKFNRKDFKAAIMNMFMELKKTIIKIRRKYDDNVASSREYQ